MYFTRTHANAPEFTTVRVIQTIFPTFHRFSLFRAQCSFYGLLRFLNESYPCIQLLSL